MKTILRLSRNLRTIPSRLQSCRPNKPKGESVRDKDKRQNRERWDNQEHSIPKDIHLQRVTPMPNHQAVNSVPAQRHMLRRLGLLHQGSPRILPHHQGGRRRKVNRNIKKRTADGMTRASLTNSHFTLERATGTLEEKEKVPSMARVTTKAISHHIKARDTEVKALEDGNGTTTNGLRLCYFLKKNIWEPGAS